MAKEYTQEGVVEQVFLLSLAPPFQALPFSSFLQEQGKNKQRMASNRLHFFPMEESLQEVQIYSLFSFPPSSLPFFLLSQVVKPIEEAIKSVEGASNILNEDNYNIRLKYV